MVEEHDKRFYVNFWRYGKELMVVACDAEILGKSFQEGDIKITIRREFYGGMLVNSREVLNYLMSADIGNLIGVNIVNLALKAGLIHRDAIMTIGGQPHAQFIKMKL
ncbi:MAG: DUF424 family protein [Candidatus Methanomethylicia archaeon]|nr:DUF424 family protein [Candidatus Methanomethylicia archaeon]